MTARVRKPAAPVCAPSGDFAPWPVDEPYPCAYSGCTVPLVILPERDGNDWIITHRRQTANHVAREDRPLWVPSEPALFADPTVRVPPECCGAPMRFAPRGWNCRVNTATWVVPTFETGAA